MPTLNYNIKTVCLNCGDKAIYTIPLGSAFKESKEVEELAIPNFAGCVFTESGYFKNYNKAEKLTIKRCDMCRVPALARQYDEA
jgi:hypothetical protein